MEIRILHPSRATEPDRDAWPGPWLLLGRAHAGCVIQPDCASDSYIATGVDLRLSGLERVQSGLPVFPGNSHADPAV